MMLNKKVIIALLTLKKILIGNRSQTVVERRGGPVVLFARLVIAEIHCMRRLKKRIFSQIFSDIIEKVKEHLALKVQARPAAR